MCRMHQLTVPTALPMERTVVHLVLTGPGGTHGWLDIKGREVRSAPPTRAIT